MINISLFASPAFAQENLLTQPAQRFTESVSYYNNLTTLFLIIAIFLSIMIVVSKYLAKNQPHIDPIHLFSKPKNKSRINIEIVDQKDNPVMHAKITLTNSNGKIVERHYTNKDGRQSISYVKSGSIIIDGFGYERVIKKINKKNIKIKIKRTSDVLLEPLSIKIRNLTWWLLVPTSFLGVYLAAFSSEYLSSELKTLLGTISVVLLLMIISNRSRALTIIDRNDKVMKNTMITFTNDRGEKIASTPTDYKGRIHSITVPGFYKISSENTVPRVVKINDNEPNLRVKLT